MKSSLALFSLYILNSFFITAQEKIYSTLKTKNEDIRIDGIFNEEAWQQVEWEGNFVQIKPYENQLPSQPTSFKILYDNNNLYIAIKAFDSAPDSIEKRMSRRDEYEGDYVGIGFDSYHDYRTAFVFVINAAGVKVDAAVTENGDNWDYNWDPIWYVKTSIDNEGWNAEMRIPFSQLRFGKKENYIWGLQVARNIYRRGEETSWQFISPNAAGWVSFFGELRGINNINPRKQKDFIPYIVADVERYEKSDDDPFKTGKGSRISGGFDGKFGLTNDFTMDITVNPDFGQVEADPSVVNLSTYETFYQEKRPFFIEGRNIMSFGLTSGGPLSSDNLFYSRRIGRTPQVIPETDDNIYVKYPGNTTILGAVKISGKTRNGWSLGFLEGVTQKEIAEIDSFDLRKSVTAEPLTNYSLFRVMKDINEGNTRMGGMITATNRQIDDPALLELRKSAYTGGLDFYHQWKNKTYFLNAKSVLSYILFSIFLL